LYDFLLAGLLSIVLISELNWM